MTQSAGHDQWATLQDGVLIIGAYTRGFTYEQLEAFMEQPGHTRPSLTLTSQWQPELEHSLGDLSTGSSSRQVGTSQTLGGQSSEEPTEHPVPANFQRRHQAPVVIEDNYKLSATS